MCGYTCNAQLEKAAIKQTLETFEGLFKMTLITLVHL